MKTQNLLTTVLLACLLIISCSKGGPNNVDTEPEPNPNMVSKDIGASGGTITSKDGKLKLTIPAGALGNTETITITPITADELGDEFDAIASEIGIANAYELGPEGQTFSKEVAISMSSEQKAKQTDGSISLVSEFLLTIAQGEVNGFSDQRMIEIEDGSGAMEITVKTTHFSPLVLTKPGLITVQVTGIPEELPRNQKAEVNISIQAEGVTPDFDNSRFYGFGFRNSEQIEAGTYEGTFEISCLEEENEEAFGLYALDMPLTSSGNINTGAYSFQLDKAITCL